MLVAVPSVSSEVERRAIEEAVAIAGGEQVTLVEEPLAAAIGAGLPIHEPIGSLIVDIGGGRSEMAVVSMGGVVTGQSVGVGGFDLDVAIQEHVRDDVRRRDRRDGRRGGQARDRLGVPHAQRQGGGRDRSRARRRATRSR